MKLFNLFEQEQLIEKSMSPGTLSKEVQQLIKQGMTPRLGYEIEICIARDPDNSYDPDEDENAPPVNDNLDYETFKNFWDENTNSEFARNFDDDYQEYVWEKQSDHWWNEISKANDYPNRYSSEKQEWLVEEFNWQDDDLLVELMDRIGADEMSPDVAAKIVSEAHKTAEELGGDTGVWSRYIDDPQSKGGQILKKNLYAVMYYQIFAAGEDSTDEWSNWLMERLQEEAQYDDPRDDYTVGQYLNEKGYETMYDFFQDNADWLIWPLGSLNGEGIDTEIQHQIKNMIEQVSNYPVDVGSYHSSESKRGNYWLIEDDSSLEPEDGDTAFEIVSPALTYREAMEQMPVILNNLKEMGAYTNQSTGMHTNVSVEGIDHDEVDWAKLAIMVGDEYVLDQFDRLGNTFAAPAVRKLAAKIKEGSAYEGDTTPLGRKVEVTAEKYVWFLDQLKTKMNTQLDKLVGQHRPDKYTSVGLKDNRIEFRSPGGEDYINQWPKIQQMTDRFISTYAMSADPEAFKKDYAKKLYKMLVSSDSNEKPGQFTDEIMRMFALYSSGQVGKEQLVAKIQNLQQYRQSARNKIKFKDMNAEYNRRREEYIDDLAKTWGAPKIGAESMLSHGFRKERIELRKDESSGFVGQAPTYPPLKLAALENAYENLKKDQSYYSNTKYDLPNYSDIGYPEIQRMIDVGAVYDTIMMAIGNDLWNKYIEAWKESGSTETPERYFSGLSKNKLYQGIEYGVQKELHKIDMDDELPPNTNKTKWVALVRAGYNFLKDQNHYQQQIYDTLDSADNSDIPADQADRGPSEQEQMNDLNNKFNNAVDQIMQALQMNRLPGVPYHLVQQWMFRNSRQMGATSYDERKQGIIQAYRKAMEHIIQGPFRTPEEVEQWFRSGASHA